VKAWIVTGISCAVLVGHLPAMAQSVENSTPIVQIPSTNPTEQGYEFLQKGWVDAAIDAFQAALKSDPQSLKATIGLAQAYQQAGKIQEAWDSYQRVLTIEPQNEIALSAIGMMGEYRPEWQKAGIAAISQLLPKSPNKIPLLTQRALLLGFQGQFDRAWADYEQILGTEFSIQTGLRAAQAAGFSGRERQAVGLYDRILQQMPDNDEAQLNRAYFALQAKLISPEDADKVLTVWVQKNPDGAPSELYNLVGALPADEKWQGLYDRVLAQVPNNLPVQRRSLQLLAQKNPQAANQQLQTLMQANPQQPLAYFVQAEVAKTLKNLELAAQSYEMLLQMQPDRGDALMALGGVRFEQRRYQEAEGLLNRAIGLMPNDWQVQRILADLYWAQDQPNQALKVLRQVDRLQRQQGIVDPVVRQQIAQLEVNNLQRRSFQPSWERY
jgi:Tfp pilus assembly protein PilF